MANWDWIRSTRPLTQSFAFCTADLNNLGWTEINGLRNVIHNRRFVHIMCAYTQNLTHRTWAPAALVMTDVMEIHWRCLQFRKDTDVVLKVKSDHSDHSSSSNSEESSSLSLHSTAIRRDRMAATSLPKWSLFSCSRCASTLRRLKPERTVTVSVCAWQHIILCRQGFVIVVIDTLWYISIERWFK